MGYAFMSKRSRNDHRSYDVCAVASGSCDVSQMHCSVTLFEATRSRCKRLDVRADTSRAQPRESLQQTEELSMKKMLSLLAGISVLALAGAASAGGPVSLTNAQMDVVTAGGSKSFDFTKNLNSTATNNVNFTGKSNITDNFTKKANIDVKSHVIGNSASLLFDNEAVGKNTNVQGNFSQETVAGQGSSQTGLFVSAANGRAFTPKY